MALKPMFRNLDCILTDYGGLWAAAQLGYFSGSEQNWLGKKSNG